MLQWLASFLTAPIINGFLDAYKAKLDAKNNAGAQAVEVTRAALIAEIEARKSANAVLIAEQGRWYTAIIRPLLALPVIVYLWKVIVWDIVLGLGGTDPIAGDVGVWAGYIVTTYVGGRSLEKIARTIWAGHDRRPFERAPCHPRAESLPHGGRARQDVGQGRRCTRSCCRREVCARRSSRCRGWSASSSAPPIG